MSNYRPQCFIRTADITAALTFPEGTPDAHEKMVAFFFAIILFMVPWLKIVWQVLPGDNVEMVCSLVFDVALEVGTRYAVVNFICIRHAAHHNAVDLPFAKLIKRVSSLYLNLNNFIYLSFTVGTGVVTKILEWIWLALTVIITTPPSSLNK